MNKRVTPWLCLVPVLHGASGLAADAPEAPPVFMSVDMEGAGISMDNCEGGQWQLGWSGAVAVESGPTADLLRSHSSFDTTQPNQGAVAAAKFAAETVTCRDKDTGGIALRATVSPSSNNEVRVTVGLASNPSTGLPTFAFTADEVGMCRVTAQMPYPDMPVMVHVMNGGGIGLSPALELSPADFEKGFTRSYQFDGQIIGGAFPCMGNQLTRGRMTMRYKAGEDDPTVGIQACLHFAKGEVRGATATGTPAGGQYRFRTPSDVLRIQSQSAGSVQVMGNRPGPSELTVEYQRGQGVAVGTMAGTVVDVVSINNGAAIPKLGLYGTNGLLRKDTYPFPLRLDPGDGFVQMTLEHDTLASVVNTASSLQLQPVKVGETQMQAKTLCGTPLGPKVRIQVVRCDDEVIKQLQAQQIELKSQIDQVVRRITGVLARDDFQDAATGIGGSTRDLAIKTGESIVSTLSFRDSRRISYASDRGIQLSKEIVVNNQRMQMLTTLWDLGNQMSDAGDYVGDPNDWQKEAKVYANSALAFLNNPRHPMGEILGPALSLGKTYGEAYLAAEKFGQHLGSLIGVSEQLDELKPQLDRLLKELVRVTERLEYCQKVPPRPEPSKPVPPKPTDPVPVEIEEPVEIPVREEPKAPEKNEPPPPSEQPGKNVVALACRIQDLRAPGIARQMQAMRQWVLPEMAAPPANPGESPIYSFGTVNIETALQRADELQAFSEFTENLRELKTLADAHTRNLAAARIDLQQFEGAVERLKVATEGTQEQARAAIPEFRQAFNAFALKSAATGDSSLDTMMATDECRDRLQVKVDQVRAHYN